MQTMPSIEPVILSAARTPIGKFQGALTGFSATELGAIAFRAALERAKVDPKEVEEVILGNVVSAGVGMAPARNAALAAGLPETISCYTVNKVCGSGLQAVMLAAQAVKAGDARVVLAGGAESMSNAPYLLPRARQGLGFGHAKVIDSLLSDGLECCVEKWAMGNAAEHIAKRFGIARDAADRFALQSQQRAVAAMNVGKFKNEIVPVEIKQKKGPPVVFDKDEGPRAETTLEKLATLKPVFDAAGVVTAGNASTLNDGSAAVVVSDRSWASAKGLKPLARILSYTTSGVAPKDIFHAPALAVPEALKRAGLQLKDIDLFEFNEAFAVQALANLKVLELDTERVNVHGGAVALGHPLGASGARVLTTLVYALQDRNKKYGCAALCLGGGNAVAMVVERL
jgi:acetyl-CoA C-acetyltransferase